MKKKSQVARTSRRVCRLLLMLSVARGDGAAGVMVRLKTPAERACPRFCVHADAGLLSLPNPSKSHVLLSEHIPPPPPPIPLPPVANQHLFSWIKHQEGLTCCITRGIISHPAHSIRQPEDGGGPRAHQPAPGEPAEKLLLPRYAAVIDLGFLPATGSLRETENTSK